MPSSDWTAQQLAGFLACLSGACDRSSAMALAVERVAEALEAEVCAVADPDGVFASVGYPREDVPLGALAAASVRRTSGTAPIPVPGAGLTDALVVPLDEASSTCLIIARCDDPLSAEEVALLRGMARVLGMTDRMLTTLEQERALRQRHERQSRENAQLVAALEERQRLQDRLARIQRSISHRDPLQTILEAITVGASELIGEPLAGMRLIDPTDPRFVILVAGTGMTFDVLHRLQRRPVGEGVGGRAIVEQRLVVVDDYHRSADAVPLLRDALHAAMAAPVRENGRVVGSLVVGTYEQGRRYSEREQAALEALAEHASLALTDAKTLEGLREAQRAKDMFLAMVSHELKTPLTVIMGALLTIEHHHDELPADVLADLLAAGRERGYELQRLIDRLLQGARAELASVREPQYLPQLVGNAVLGFDRTRDLEVGPVPEADVLVDGTGVREVIGVLLENAVAHAEASGTIALHTAIEDGEIAFAVRNPGALPPELDPGDLFAPFQRGDTTTSSGVGLGLHIAARLAESMGGRIEAASEAGNVTFTLRIPHLRTPEARRPTNGGTMASSAAR